MPDEFVAHFVVLELEDLHGANYAPLYISD
jgi:hypothetical protein